MARKSIRLGDLELGDVPLVVGVISSPRTMDRPLDVGALPMDVAEFRVDLFGTDTPGWLDRVDHVRAGGKPVILTVRHASEGGHWFLGEDERLAVYRSALPFVSAIDVEIRSESFSQLAHDAHRAGKLVIGSFHDFERTPAKDELEAIMQLGRKSGADVVKLATLTPGREEVDRLGSLLDNRSPGLPLCLLGMGELGGATRAELARRGSCLTYGYFDQANAPGQLSCGDLREQLAREDERYRAFVAGRTR